MKPIQPGSKAPSFTLPQQDGTPVSLEQLLQSGPVVLFWYPAASSGGCTIRPVSISPHVDAFTSSESDLPR